MLIICKNSSCLVLICKLISYTVTSNMFTNNPMCVCPQIAPWRHAGVHLSMLSFPPFHVSEPRWRTTYEIFSEFIFILTTIKTQLHKALGWRIIICANKGLKRLHVRLWTVKVLIKIRIKVTIYYIQIGNWKWKYIKRYMYVVWFYL